MLNINLEWDPNALAAPQSFRNGVQAAANLLEAAIYDPITVNIEVGYGEYDDGGTWYTPLTSYSLGGTAPLPPIQVSYPLLRAALANDETSPTDAEAVNSLPNATSLNGQTTFIVAGAQAKALGAIPAADPALDGYVGFPTTFTGNGLIDAAIVEITHAMGLLTGGDGVLSLFTFTSPGNHLITQGVTTAVPAYFSMDGGNTDLANYDVDFDETLFLNLNGDPLSVPNTGSTVLTPLDLTEIGAIGFDDTSTPSLPTPGIIPTQTTSGAPAAVNVRNVTVTMNTPIPVLSLITSVSVPSGDTIASYGFYDQGGGTGYFAVNGVTEPDGQWIDVLDTQLSTLQYVGGSAPGHDLLDVVAFDNTADQYTQVSQLTATTVTPSPPLTVNNPDGTSDLYVYHPTSTATQTITEYSGPNNTGAAISDIVDNTDGTSLLYAYNPTHTVTQTAQAWSGTNAANGAPAGNEISDVVDDTNGTSLVYAYNPTSTVTLAAQEWSGTNAANGAPAGSEISDVVDDTNGTSIVYAYNPASTVTQTASFYGGTNPDGSPTGRLTGATFDYTNGESSITTYNPNGTSTTQYYSGPDGTGALIAPPGSMTTSAAATVTLAEQDDASLDSGTIAIAGSDQLIDPGTGSRTILFGASATNDALVLHSGGTDQILGFDPSAGDTLDLSSLFAEAGVSIGDVSGLANYVSVANVDGSAAIVFDPAGLGGGSQVALLANDGGVVAQLQTLKAFEV